MRIQIKKGFALLFLMLASVMVGGCELPESKQEPNEGQDYSGSYRFSGSEAVSVPLKLIRGLHPVVAVSVANRRLDLLVDTGTTWTQLPASVFGTSPTGWIRVSRMCLEGGLCFENFLAQVTDNNYVSNRSGTFNGILGVHLLRNHVVTFDYANAKLHIGRGPAKNAISLPIQWDNKTARPFAAVSINGVPVGGLLLDTGASYSRLTTKMAQQSGIAAKNGVVDRSITTTSIDPIHNISVDRFCLGSMCRRGMPVSIAGWPAIGGTYLRHYVVTFDFPELMLYLVPLQNHTEADKGFRRYGLRLHPQNPGLVVHVRRGSAAERAGIASGDRLLRVGGADIVDQGYFALAEMMSASGSQMVELSIRSRHGEVKSVVLRAD